MNFTRTSLADLLCQACENEGFTLTKAGSLRVADGIVDRLAEELVQGNHIRFKDIGVLKPSEHKAREARNPRTGEAVHIPARRTIRFVTGKGLKAALNGV